MAASTVHDTDVPQELLWLEREAPQFHHQIEPVPTLPRYPAAGDDDDDGSSVSSRDESDHSDTDEDPYHPYNVADNSKQWIRDGDYVYAADDLRNSYLAPAHNHVVDDAPYVPPPMPGANKSIASYISPVNLAPDDVFVEPYAFSESAPRQQQAISPLELTCSLPTSPAPSSSSRNASRRSAAVTRPHVTYNDDDGDVESSADDASEDEYIPSPHMRTRKLPSSRGSTQTRPSRHSFSPYPSSSSPASTSTAESGSRRPGSRNVQIFDQPPPPRGSWSKTGPDAYTCPYCNHYQENKRSPDMERHIRSHFRSAGKQWVCCGVPIEQAAQYSLSPSDNAWMFNGQMMVGGCHEDFSRMDALKRHWKNKNNTCVGDIRYARADGEE